MDLIVVVDVVVEVALVVVCVGVQAAAAIPTIIAPLDVDVAVFLLWLLLQLF